MKKITKLSLAGSTAVATISFQMSSSALAIQKMKEGLGKVNTGGPATVEEVLPTVVNVLLFLIGALSVIMIIYGGIRYVTSGGDQGAITSAKNTIMYSVVGLVVAILAYAIVNFVIARLTTA